MKKMFFSLILVMSVCCALKAQESTWGIRTGMNVSTVSEKVDEGADPDYKSLIGFRFGVIGDLGITEKFYVQPGLYFTSLGAKQEVYDKDATVRLNYLQLPILASLRIALSDKLKLHLNAGPYVAYGISGKQKYDGVKINAFGTDDEEGGLKRFDAGLSFGAGIEVNKAYFGFGYDLGLTNILDDEVWYTDEVKSRNRNFFITVGVNF